MNAPALQGIIPPLPTPLTADRRQVDLDALVDLVDLHLAAGVQGLWVLGTTARFDLLTDADQRAVAETVARQASGRVPLVLNLSDQGAARTLERACLFQDLPYDFYAALPPLYLKMTPKELDADFRRLADGLDKPLVVYNAPWVCNHLSLEQLRPLADHPRIVGTKDVTPELGRKIDWPHEERREQGFAYLHGSDLILDSTVLGADGFVSALSDVVPALAVDLWNAARAGDLLRASRLQERYSRLGHAVTRGSLLAGLDAAGRHLGLFRSMLPPPLEPLSVADARNVARAFDHIGHLPEAATPAVAETSVDRSEVQSN